MAIDFISIPDENYFLTTFSGTVTDAELLSRYKSFMQSKDWQPGMNELVDMQQASMGQLSSAGLRQLQEFVEEFLSARNAAMRTAIFAPNDLPYGLARIYSALADSSPELIKTFRDREEARLWLDQPDPDAESPAATSGATSWRSNTE